MSLNPFLSRCASIAFVAFLSLVWTTESAFAEKMRTNTETQLRKRPGEAARVITTLKPGKTVRVLKRKGRWIRVRVGKRTGWVTRTTLEPLDGMKTDGTDGKWSKTRKSTKVVGASPTETRYVTIKKHASDVYREPDKNASVVYTLEQGMIATVTGDTGKRKPGKKTWLLIENQDGQLGWIRASRVKTVTDRDAVLALRPRTETLAQTDTRSVRKSRIIVPRVEASFGYRGLAMNFNSNGGNQFDQYRIEAPSALTQAGIWIPFEIAGFLIEAGGSYAFSVGRPGIRLPDNMGDISFLTHDAHVGAHIGYRFMDGLLTVAGTGGFHFSVFRPDDIDNAAFIPSERLTGITAGGIVELAPGQGKYVIRSGFRVLIGGERAQTEGLEDGQISTANAMWASIDIDYAIWAAFDLVAGYTYERATTEWLGDSARRPGVTFAERTDNNHLLYMGLGRAF